MSNLRRLTGPSNFRAALGCALGLAVVLVWTPAKAGDDDDAPDTKFFRSILEGIGLQHDDNNGINYQERAPLVIPPSRMLPPPETDAATKNPNWPVDPEVKRERQVKAAERSKAHNGAEMDDQARALRPDQLKSGPNTNSARDQGAMGEDKSASVFKPSELGYKGGLWNNIFGKDQDSARFTGEPPRASLTDPPPGYQTPSPDQPYGKGNENVTPKAFDYKNDRATQNN